MTAVVRNLVHSLYQMFFAELVTPIQTGTYPWQEGAFSCMFNYEH
jgi:hypothetical protein